jgi:hypothetical protein
MVISFFPLLRVCPGSGRLQVGASSVLLSFVRAAAAGYGLFGIRPPPLRFDLCPRIATKVPERPALCKSFLRRYL